MRIGGHLHVRPVEFEFEGELYRALHAGSAVLEQKPTDKGTPRRHSSCRLNTYNPR